MKPHNNLSGIKFDKLTVIEQSSDRIHGRVSWLCKCDCDPHGTNLIVRNDKQLKVLKSNDCGCSILKDSKVCSICKIEKPKSGYHKRAGRDIGVQSKCIECVSEYKKKRYWGNRDEELGKMTKSRLKPKNVQQRKAYYIQNKEEYRERYLKYIADEEKREKKKQTAILYKQTEAAKANNRAWHKERRKSDIGFLITTRLRARLRHIIADLRDKKYKKLSALELLGCDMIFFKKHIEDRFTEGMSWEVISKIDIDHIKPVSKFDMRDIEEQKRCFHFSNLQPLWKADNRKKWHYYDGD